MADHEKYTNIGHIPNYAYQNYIEMYEAYHALGGNGMITKMLEEIKDLKLQEERGELKAENRN